MGSKKLSKDEILQLLKSHHASEETAILNEVSYNLAIASIAQDRLLEKASAAITKLKQYRPISALSQAKNNTPPPLHYCPVCKFEMETVKLLEDKAAWYCPDHRIVVPKPVE